MYHNVIMCKIINNFKLYFPGLSLPPPVWKAAVGRQEYMLTPTLILGMVMHHLEQVQLLCRQTHTEQLSCEWEAPWLNHCSKGSIVIPGKKKAGSQWVYTLISLFIPWRPSVAILDTSSLSQMSSAKWSETMAPAIDHTIIIYNKYWPVLFHQW